MAAQSSAKTKKQEPVNYWVELPKPDGMDQWLETQPPRSASNKKSLQQKHQQQSQPPPPPHKKAPKAPLTPSDDEEVEVEEQEREDEDALSIRSVSTADMRSGRGATASASGSHLQLSHLPPRPPRKKVLLVGINYTGTDAELSGCVNDVKNIYRLVTTRWGYLDTPETMRILTDEHKKDKKKLPTKANILSGLRWLMEDVRAGDKLYFHFSGHGK